MATRTLTVVAALLMVGLMAPRPARRTSWLETGERREHWTSDDNLISARFTDTATYSRAVPNQQAIAHSLGGLVAREAARTVVDGSYGQIIEISHDGARFTVLYSHLTGHPMQDAGLSKDSHLHFQIRRTQDRDGSPTITSISPAGPNGGTSFLTIRGAGYRSGMQVRIEGSAVATVEDAPIGSTLKPLAAASYLLGAVREMSAFQKAGTGGDIATPRAASHSEHGSAAAVEFERGRILVIAPAQMKVAQPQKVVVRVAREEFGDLWPDPRPLLGHAPVIADVTTGRYMGASLLVDQQTFRVLPISTSSQLLERPGITQWVWVVTPLKSGMHQLHILLKLHYSFSEVASRDVYVGDRVVYVQRNPVHSATEFASSNWMALFSLPFLAGGFGLIARSVRRKRRAGF